MAPTVPAEDRLLRVRGTVQGVGFRPFVARLAAEFGLRGWVRNDPEGVLVRAIGGATELEQLAAAITTRAPAAAVVSGVEWSAPQDDTPGANGAFCIIESGVGTAAVETNVPVDLAPCADCRRELLAEDDRRRGYVFINCTQCGPRYSIIETLPYDRPRTTMRCFRMCAACQREYGDPADRRFHAEPNACPVCGPELRLTDVSGALMAKSDHALALAVAALLNGEIVAVKGVGGFHLMVDAQNEKAVAELRRRKHREQKPLAVMFRDVPMLERWATVSPAAATLLTSPQAPILLVPRRDAAGGSDPGGRPADTRPAGTSSALAASLAPGNPWIGALLPSSPVHLRLLAAANRPLVATSANLTDEPLCTDDDEARVRLAGIADLFLGHNRPIARPVDDSVLRFSRSGTRILLRRARGFAPTPLRLPSALAAPVVCVGAQMKNTIAVACGERVILSPHLGDLDGFATQQVFTRTIETLSRLFEAQPTAVVCDKHPDYASTRWAENCGLRRIAVQHHLAHVLAVLLEHNQKADEVLGVSWDGTGYGEDGTIWGGEFILLREGRAFRFARLRPFRLPGGDACIKDPRRAALSLAWTAELANDGSLARRFGFSDLETETLHRMLARGLNSPLCSSVGRLFDAFGALLGISDRNAFEGQTPLAVEIAATLGLEDAAAAAVNAAPTQHRPPMQASTAPEARAAEWPPICCAATDMLPFPVRRAAEGALWEIDWQPALERVLENRDRSPAELAAGLHRGLANAIAEVAALAGVPKVALAGGCFQNALLRDFTDAALIARRFRVLAARDLPPNDGAIAAGQALGALWNLTTVALPAGS